MPTLWHSLSVPVRILDHAFEPKLVEQGRKNRGESVGERGGGGEEESKREGERKRRGRERGRKRETERETEREIL